MAFDAWMGKIGPLIWVLGVFLELISQSRTLVFTTKWASVLLTKQVWCTPYNYCAPHPCVVSKLARAFSTLTIKVCCNFFYLLQANATFSFGSWSSKVEHFQTYPILPQSSCEVFHHGVGFKPQHMASAWNLRGVFADNTMKPQHMPVASNMRGHVPVDFLQTSHCSTLGRNQLFGLGRW